MEPNESKWHLRITVHNQKIKNSVCRAFPVVFKHCTVHAFRWLLIKPRQRPLHQVRNEQYLYNHLSSGNTSLVSGNVDINMNRYGLMLKSIKVGLKWKKIIAFYSSTTSETIPCKSQHENNEKRRRRRNENEDFDG